MARYYTSNTLIRSAIRKAMIPVTQVTFKEADFLAFANEEMDTAIIPYILSFHEDYFLFPAEIPLQSNVSKYPIPYRAVGNKLREVNYRDTGNNLYEMTRILVEDAPYYGSDGNTSGNSPLRAFFINNNYVNLSPELNFQTQGFLRMWYYLRPNQLVSEDRALIINAVDRTTGQISVETLPNIYSVETLVDFIQVKSPHKCLSIDITPVSIDTTNAVITFNIADIPDELVAGDHICLAEECIIPQIPTDLHSLLAQRIAARCLEALGDQQGLQAANAKLAEMELKLGTVIDDRVEGAPFKVNNRHSALKNARNYYRR